MKTLDVATKRLLQDPIKRRAWIKYQIHCLGFSMANVAANATPPMDRRNFYQVFNHPFPRAEKIISTLLQYRPQDLFPDRYDADGLPNRRMGRRPYKFNVNAVKNNTDKQGRNIKKFGAK